MKEEKLPPRLLSRKIQWPNISRVFEKNGQSFQIRPIDKKDIPFIAPFFKKFSPYLLGSIRQNFFEESFYQKEVALLSNWDQDSLEKLYFFGLLETLPENKLIMAFGCVRDAYDLVIQNLNVTLDTGFRGQDISIEYATYLDEVWQKCGTDYVYGFMSTRHTFSQKIFLKMGAQFGGVLPGIFRRTEDQKTYYRDTELSMYKFYNGAENYLKSLEECEVIPELHTQVQELLMKFKK